MLSKRRDAPCAYRAHYADGVLVPPPGARAGGTTAAPQPCAGVDGTTITVEDLFHNMTIRRRALRSPAEQYQRILEVVTRYAIHFGVRGVAFTCTKHGAPSADLHVTAAAAASRRNIIRLVSVHARARARRNRSPLRRAPRTRTCISYGGALEQELIELRVDHGDVAATDRAAVASGDAPATAAAGAAALAYSARGFISSSSFSSKKPVFILFVNDRLVESSALRRTVEAAFAEALPRGAHPWARARQRRTAHVDSHACVARNRPVRGIARCACARRFTSLSRCRAATST